MSLHVKPRDVAGWVAQAEGAGLEVTAPARRKRPKRTPEQMRADLLRALERAQGSPLAVVVLSRALRRFDMFDSEEHQP